MQDKRQEAISIENILFEDQYLVPIYQRNYEWEKEQISKLITDIKNFDGKYYLGTLVTSKTSNGQFELIDGQQRHTTLNLIKYYLKEQIEQNFTENKRYKKCFETHNINFQARKECKFFFDKLVNGTNSLPENFKSKNLLNGINIIKNIFIEEKIDIEKFADKFFDKTFLFRTELPENTNLNHYFEIMNNRGEQLEKHEILKAQLMGILKNDNKEDFFSEIWDACSDMGDYIWNNFKREFSLKIFSKDIFDFDSLLHEFNEISKQQEANNDIDFYGLDDIIESHNISDKFSQEEQEKTAKFRSVLDFSEFLIYTYNNINLTENTYDDKKLLEIFKDYVDSENFIIELLKTRIYFDKYVVKQVLNADDKNQNWGIRDFETKDNIYNLKETAFENSKYEDKIEMLQSMFYYSGIANIKKEWLVNLLKEQPKSDEEIYNNLLRLFHLEINKINISEKYPEINTKTFYYIDYMLWETYFNFLKGETNLDKLPLAIKNLGGKINKDLFSNFKFRQLNSKEHLLPQSQANKEEEIVLNDLGNLCLISASQNSSANDQHPKYKRRDFQSDNSSLKRLIMFANFIEDEYSINSIKAHQDEMVEFLDYYKKN
ncbi:DUF262 domain-containing protein [Epilithonimonas sp.]|uniref:DUF262 domain-containing protein n=1 Tax=Epilithonimonas sp. TaxID=2894511 RepID=UPI00289A48C6|nr:DUF262 domain-containing protein [Epilithonimonas sp.]